MNSKIHFSTRVTCMFCMMLFSLSIQAQYQLSPTQYDWSELAQSITQDANTNLEKAKAIFDWIGEHIAYDVTHTVRTADKCFEKRKGVCQAYSELFYRLCEPLDIGCTIISGWTKNEQNKISRDGHAWVYVETEKGGILVDPTWGAGGLKNGHYTKNKKDYWFDVDPYWMIFTHLPKDQKWQLIASPINETMFESIPTLKPDMEYIGWDAKAMLSQLLNKKISSLPTLFPGKSDKMIKLKNIPLTAKLKPARTYRFEIENPHGLEFAIVVNSALWYHSERWEKQGDVYSIDMMPGAGGRLCIVTKNDHGSYDHVVEYQVEKPTAKEQEYIDENGPPAITPLSIKTIELHNIPKTGNLNPAKHYRFEVENPENIKFAISVNKTWYHSENWKRKGNIWWIDILPAEGGELKILVENEQGSYTCMVKYKVYAPTEEEKEYIRTHQPPKFYPLGWDGFKLLDYPQYKVLNPTESYHFEVENPEHVNFAIVINDTWHKSKEWKRKGTKYSIDLVPGQTGLLQLYVQKPNKSKYTLILEHEVTKRTKKK